MSQNKPEFPRPSLPAPGKAARWPRLQCALQYPGLFLDPGLEITGPPGSAPGHPRPIAVRLAVRPAPSPAAGRGGCYTRRPARCAAGGENLPPPPPPPSALRAGGGARPGLGRRNLRPSWDGSRWEAPRPAALLRLPNCSLTLGRASYTSPSPTLPLSCPRRGPCCVLLQGPARCQCPGETFAAGEDCFSARAPLPVSSLLPEPHAPRVPRSTFGERRSSEVNGRRNRDRRTEPSWTQTLPNVATA